MQSKTTKSNRFKSDNYFLKRKINSKITFYYLFLNNVTNTCLTKKQLQ